MVKTLYAEPRPHSHLLLRFSDGTDKLLDVRPFLGADTLTAPLRDPAFFRQVRPYDNGRGIYWPNDFDLCPDYLRYHAPDARANPAETQSDYPLAA